ncbi:MAG: flavodoxin-dependent (E)-4-hydroxy-3-methylbut-2-enyl-diphosphate synthase, partial [Butyricicoccus sp.]|nr:flavodoxin-dependent (E)-4-hydroxy-3-methylbut-2-enyl-diphosphate synthase [Butyricicoccus sp.]
MKTKQIFVGNVPVGGGAPIAVQSMTNTDTRDAQATLAQIERLASAGCHIVRCTANNMTACGRQPLNLR